MGRVKIAPTPRAAALNDAMRRAATQISPPTAESMKKDLASASKPTKPAGRNSLPTPRGSQDRATSEPAGKRKAASESKTASKDTKLALRSSTKPSATPSATPTIGDDTLDMPADGPPSKRQKVDDAISAPRRSARSKIVKEDATPPPPKPLRSSSRNQKVPSSVASEVDEATPTPAPEQHEGSAVPQGTNKTESVNVQSPSDAVVDGPDSLPSPTSATSDTQVMAVNATRRESGPPLRKTMSQPPPSALDKEVMAAVEVCPDMGDTDAHPPSSVPPNGMNLGPVPNIPGQQMHYGIPPPGSWIQTPNGLVQVSGTGATVNAQNKNGQPQGLIPMQDASVAPGPYMQTHGIPHLAPPVGANGMPLQYLPSRRGQKVKGRPPPKNASSSKSRSSLPVAQSPDPHVDDVDTKNGALANTYPRKQPFKAQIEFPGYPPPNAEIPANYTMWDICQLMPNSLRENNLRAFVQREWSANELCACLKDDARAILNSRQGKDKTMVFQKRMERIKKDLVAKGEYEALLRAPYLRDDGRPTWVKRGNVRRK